MAVIENNSPETKYISCPHLTADHEVMHDEGGFYTLVDDGQAHVVLLLCGVCNDVVKSGILDKIVSKSIADSVRHLGLLK